jgi:hypothetical protein
LILSEVRRLCLEDYAILPALKESRSNSAFRNQEAVYRDPVLAMKRWKRAPDGEVGCGIGSTGQRFAHNAVWSEPSMGALRRDPGLSPDEEHGRFVTKIRNAGAVGFTVAFLLDSFELRLGVSKTDPQASCRAFSSRNKGKEMTVIPLDLDQIRSEILPNGTRRWTS